MFWLGLLPRNTEHGLTSDFDPPVALDPAATAVELANLKLEMDMHFAYTLAQNTLSLALMVDGQCPVWDW
jgi:hypothetical protein